MTTSATRLLSNCATRSGSTSHARSPLRSAMRARAHHHCRLPDIQIHERTPSIAGSGFCGLSYNDRDLLEKLVLKILSARPQLRRRTHRTALLAGTPLDTSPLYSIGASAAAPRSTARARRTFRSSGPNLPPSQFPSIRSRSRLILSRLQTTPCALFSSFWSEP